jgi:hypothetical protein
MDNQKNQPHCKKMIFDEYVTDIYALRRNRIEDLKERINDDEYVREAIRKLANSLTTGLMK